MTEINRPEPVFDAIVRTTADNPAPGLVGAIRIGDHEIFTKPYPIGMDPNDAMADLLDTWRGLFSRVVTGALR